MRVLPGDAPPLSRAGEGGRDPRGVPSPCPCAEGTYDALACRGVIAASYREYNSPREICGTTCEMNLTSQ